MPTTVTVICEYLSPSPETQTHTQAHIHTKHTHTNTLTERAKITREIADKKISVLSLCLSRIAKTHVLLSATLRRASVPVYNSELLKTNNSNWNFT